METPTTRSSDGYRIHGIIGSLALRHHWSEYGRVCQALLALTFSSIRFRISNFQFSGRPDFCAHRSRVEYAVEAKAPLGNDVLLKKEDLDGVLGLGLTPVIAVLTYPEIETQWIVADAARIKPRKLSKASLKQLSLIDLENEINGSFLSVLERNRMKALAGADPLSAELDNRAVREWTDSRN